MSVRGKTAGGQPGRHAKPTSDEKELRTRVVLELMAQSWPDGEIKKRLAIQFKMSTRSVEPYLREARARMRYETGKSKEDLRIDSFTFYQSVLRNSNATISEKIKARAQMDKLLGLAAPASVNLGFPSNGPTEDGEKKDASKAVAQVRQIYGLNSSTVPGNQKSA